MQRIVEIDDDDAVVGGDVGEMPSQHDMPCAIQHAVPSFQVSARVRKLFRGSRSASVSTSVRIRPFDGIGNRRVAVDRMKRLLLVRDPHQVALVPQRIDRLVGRQRDTRRVGRRDMRIVAERRERRRDDLLRDALVGDARGVVHAHPARAFGDEEIFAAQLQATRRALRLVRRDRGQPVVALLVRGVPVGVRVAVQVAADHRLRLLPFGHLDGAHALFLADPRVEADEVDEVGSLQQQLRHDRVVVVGVDTWQSVQVLVSVLRSVCG